MNCVVSAPCVYGFTCPCWVSQVRLAGQRAEDVVSLETLAAYVSSLLDQRRTRVRRSLAASASTQPSSGSTGGALEQLPHHQSYHSKHPAAASKSAPSKEKEEGVAFIRVHLGDAVEGDCFLFCLFAQVARLQFLPRDSLPLSSWRLQNQRSEHHYVSSSCILGSFEVVQSNVRAAGLAKATRKMSTVGSLGGAGLVPVLAVYLPYLLLREVRRLLSSFVLSVNALMLSSTFWTCHPTGRLAPLSFVEVPTTFPQCWLASVM